MVEDLVIEAMQIKGMDVFYLPRSTRDEVDYLYGEDTLKQYTFAYPLEMYLENVTGMDGEGDFISKFGLEIRDEITLLLSRRRFAATVPQNRPKEGDLVYVPLVENFFEITFVEHENDQAMFYTLGRGRDANIYVYGLKLKQFNFSEEIIDTGIEEVDDQAFDSYRRTKFNLGAGTGKFIYKERIYQGESLENSTARGLVHSAPTGNTELQIVQIIGSFVANTVVIGETSNAQYTLTSTGDLTEIDSNVFEDIIDNKVIENEGDSFIDFSENNPFGEP